MVTKRQCSFCAGDIEPGTGTMYVKRDGTIFHFCSGSCRKQQLHLGRVGHRFKWTRAHAIERAAEHGSATARPAASSGPAQRTMSGRVRAKPAAVPAPKPEPAEIAKPSPPEPTPTSPVPHEKASKSKVEEEPAKPAKVAPASAKPAAAPPSTETEASTRPRKKPPKPAKKAE